jgi:hypothetical protein
MASKPKKLKRKLLFTLPCGGHDVPVSSAKGLIEHFSASGRFLPMEMVIEIDDGLTEDNFWDTLIHESVHVCEHVFGFNLREAQVRQLGIGLHSMLKGFIQR